MFERIRIWADRIVSRVIIFFVSRFDRSVESLISSFTRLDARLDNFVARQETKRDILNAQWDAAQRRIFDVQRIENSIQAAVDAAEDEVTEAIERAKRIKSKITDLIS